jgi:ring-1,2-phenylacetyl-CoA epoxidase subunit PaaB
MSEKSTTKDQWDLWEVFIQKPGNLPHQHAGSVRGSDPENALQNARDVFARRGTIKSIWVIRTDHINSSNPDDAASFFEPTADKVYRHPHFYKYTLDDELWKRP